MKYLQLNDIGCYKRSLNLSSYVWEIVIGWEWFSKRTVGIQFVTAVDSISANLAEGFGRYSKKDQYTHILQELTELPKEIHHLINYTNAKLEK